MPDLATLMNGLGLTWPDLAAFLIFVTAWSLYHRVVERLHARESLNVRMNRFRADWMREMAVREPRIIDTQIMGSLQNGTAFFASTSLIALGASGALLRAGDDALRLFADLPFTGVPSRALFELKVAGLVAIFCYAFFKFAWAYRLFNFAAILLGATPPADSPDIKARDAAAKRTAGMAVAAGRHFTRGQRAFFFSIAYMGWFLGAGVMIAATLGVVTVMWMRQFRSDALHALDPD